MIKKVLFTLTSVTLLAGPVAAAHEPAMRISTSRSLSPVLDAVKQLPEGQKLIERVRAQGRFKIREGSLGNINAKWDGGDRIIYINTGYPRSMGSLIASLIVELHNALGTEELARITNEAWRGVMGKEQFVEGVERFEHRNCIEASKLLNLGIARGVFPPDAKWPIYADFDDYYICQQLGGHSQWLSDYYDQMHGQKTPYYGTIPDLDTLTQADKNDLHRYLGLKEHLRSTDHTMRQWAEDQLLAERQTINACMAGELTPGCDRADKRHQFLELVFG